MKRSRSIWVLLIFLALSWGEAQACDEELKVREYLPQNGAEDVPINSRMVVAFIGMGSLDEFEVTVFNAASTRNIGVDQEGWCYTHEGPNELHCWVRLTPRQALEAWTTYEIRVQRLAVDTAEPEEEPDVGAFTTSDQEASSSVGALGFEVTDAWQMKPSQLDSCDWDAVSRWWFEVDPVTTEPTGLDLFHIFELDGAGQPLTSDPIHTLFSPRSSQPEQVKQYLDGSKAHSDCFGILREGPAGEQGSMTTDCFEKKKGEGDTSDTSPSDSGTPRVDSGPSGEETGQIPDATGSQAPVYPVPQCGCGAPGSPYRGWGLGSLIALSLLWTRRRRAYSSTSRTTISAV